MTIDTSREAVEQINEELSWDDSLGAIELINALLAERDAALAEVARLSTSPDDAGVVSLTGEAHSMSRQAARPLWQDVSRLIDAMADALTRLSHALAAETAKRDAMEEALRTVDAQLQGLGYQADGAMRHGVRATLAKHGSKT